MGVRNKGKTFLAIILPTSLAAVAVFTGADLISRQAVIGEVAYGADSTGQSNIISGTVRDATGLGIGGAVIKYCASLTNLPVDCTTSNALQTGVASKSTGEWVWSNPPTGSYYTFFAYLNGQQSSFGSTNGPYVGGTAVIPDLRFSVPMSGTTQNFTLTVDKGGPGNIFYTPPGANCGYAGAVPPCVQSYASGTAVTLMAQNDPVTGSMFSGWSGACSGTDVTCTVTMTADQYVKATFTVPQTTPASGSISGYASGPNGAVVGATVTVAQDGGTLVKTAVTSTTGYYAVGDLPLGFLYQIVAAPPPGAALIAPPPTLVALSSAEPNAKVDFAFTAKAVDTATITGRVLNADGTPAAKVRVEAWAEQRDTVSTTTALDGTYTLSVPSATWEVRVFVDAGTGAYADPSSRRVSVDAGGRVADVNFTIIRGNATITGRLIDEETGALVPVTNAWAGVRALSVGAPISDGSFTFSVPPGSFAVEVWLPDTSGYVSTAPVDVEVKAGQSVAIDVKVRSAAKAGGKIVGGVFDTAGNPVSGIGIEVFAVSGASWFRGTVETSGKFTILVPAGTWSFGFRVKDSRYAAVSSLGEPVVVTVGQTVTRNITVTRLEGASLTVELKKPDGSPFPNVGVEVSTAPFTGSGSPVTSSVSISRFAYSDAQGTARFTLPAATYYVRAFTPPEIGFANPSEQSITLAANDGKSLTLVFRRPGAILTGRVLSKSSTIADAFVSAWSQSGGVASTRSSSDGSYELHVVAGERWQLRAAANVGGHLLESPTVTVDLTSRSSATEDLLLSATPFAIPSPLTATAAATQPFSTKLGNGVQLACAANCFAASGQVQVVVQPDIAAPQQGGVRVIGVAYSIEARKADGTVVKQLSDEAVVSIPYDPALVAAKGIAESELRIGFFDEISGRWQILDRSAVDAVAKVVTARTNHLTRFALVTPASATVIAVPLKEGDLIRGPDGIKVYIINRNGYKRHIFNPAVFAMYKHFTWETIRDVSQAVLDSYVTSDLYRAEGDPKVYALTEIDEAKGRAEKRWLDMTPERFVQRGYSWKQVFIVNAQERDYYATGAPLQ